METTPCPQAPRFRQLIQELAAEFDALLQDREQFFDKNVKLYQESVGRQGMDTFHTRTMSTQTSVVSTDEVQLVLCECFQQEDLLPNNGQHCVSEEIAEDSGEGSKDTSLSKRSRPSKCLFEAVVEDDRKGSKGTRGSKQSEPPNDSNGSRTSLRSRESIVRREFPKRAEDHHGNIGPPARRASNTKCRSFDHRRSRIATITAGAPHRDDPKEIGMFILETAPALVILANALTIGMSADVAPKSMIWKILEATWIACYTLEFTIKIKVYGVRGYFKGEDSKWNWFDFICLAISLCDLCITYLLTFVDLSGGAVGLVKVIRLARLARLVRALQFSWFAELKQMVLGVVLGVRVLAWAIVLFLVVIFFLGVVLNVLIGDTENELRTVPNAMFTIFRCYTDGCTAYNGTPLQERLFEEYGAAFFFGYILSFMFVTVGIFNLIMAIFIENVAKQNLQRRLQDIAANAVEVTHSVKSTLARLIADTHPDWARKSQSLEQLDSEEVFACMQGQDIPISRTLFEEWLQYPLMQELLEMADVEIAEKMSIFDVLDVDMSGELDLDELITGIMKLRGPITKSDIVAVRLKVRYITGILEDMWEHIHDQGEVGDRVKRNGTTSSTRSGKSRQRISQGHGRLSL